ncbi:MAG TPA: hypothetical protein VK534_00240 [Methylomirabilota bacterium]|nr:hypothetical protein [Methylomirabilota bacterium]
MADTTSSTQVWPGAFGIYKQSRDAVRLNLAALACFWILSAVIGGIVQYKTGVLGQLASFFVNAIATTGFILLFLAGVRKQKLQFEAALKKCWELLIKMVLLELLVVLALVASLILLVIPFFFVLPRVILAPYYLVDKDMGVMDAFQASIDNTKGHAGKVWGVVGANIAMALLMITIIGIPFAIYFLVMYTAAFAVVYEYINKHTAPTKAEPAIE